MPTLAHHFRTCAYQNAWVNLRLLRACAQLDDREFGAPRTSFFPSLAATLNHLLTVDLYYVDALERTYAGSVPNPEARAFFEPAIPHPRCVELAGAQRAVDLRLIAVCLTLDDAALQRRIEVPRRWGVQREPATRLLAHLFQHQIHHRGQAHAMLAGTCVAPPQLDEFYCEGEAPLRAAELAELGVSEQEIWGR